MCVSGLQLYVLSPVPSKRSGPFRITSHSVALAVPEVRCNGECNCNSTSQLVSKSNLHCTECDQFSRWREAADMASKSVLGGHTEKLSRSHFKICFSSPSTAGTHLSMQREKSFIEVPAKAESQSKMTRQQKAEVKGNSLNTSMPGNLREERELEEPSLQRHLTQQVQKVSP